MKNETLEEAAEKYSLELLEAKTIQPHEKTWIKSMFIYIAKWQAERMYSEEDLKKAIDLARVFSKITENDGYDEFEYTPIEIIQQFKNK
jgi:hypothetical protein